MSIDSKLPNNICKKELRAIYLRLKHYTVHYYNYQTLYFYNYCNTNHSHNLDLSSIYSIHSFHQHVLDSYIHKLFTQKKGCDKEMKLRVYVICLLKVISKGKGKCKCWSSFLASNVGLYSYMCSEHIWRNALSLRNQACSKHSSVCYSKI